jgi:hypothetical protein
MRHFSTPMKLKAVVSWASATPGNRASVTPAIRDYHRVI